jgi:hypothetical protein
MTKNQYNLYGSVGKFASRLEDAYKALKELYGDDPRLSEMKLLHRLEVGAQMADRCQSMMANTDAGRLDIEWPATPDHLLP